MIRYPPQFEPLQVAPVRRLAFRLMVKMKVCTPSLCSKNAGRSVTGRKCYDHRQSPECREAEGKAEEYRVRGS